MNVNEEKISRFPISEEIARQKEVEKGLWVSRSKKSGVESQ